MSYALITTDGDFAWDPGAIDWDTIIGPEGKARAGLHPSFAVAAYVNDVGLCLPDRYPRNIVGSCVLAAFGAAPQPYAGTVAFVGWDAANTLRGRSEIVPLTLARANSLADVHADVRRALAGDPPRAMSPSWGEQIREYAEHARTAPAPTLTMRPVRLP
ncbi:hypothetical protein ACVB8X_14205 [Streptomyces sp. NRAIS4]